MPSDARKLPFFSRHAGKIATTVIVGLPVMWLMDSHLEYTTSEHGRGENNPVSYLAWGLGKASDDAGKALTVLGETSDHITATVKGQPVPTKEPEVPDYAKPRSLHDFQVNVCVPPNLVTQESWKDPAPGSKMDVFRSMLRDFILASGDPRIQYRIREGAFERFDPARPGNPQSYVATVDARQDCPSTNYRFTLLVPAR